MAFNPDFTNFNEGLQALMRSVMTDWVGRRNDERSMEYLNRSGEMWTKKAEEDAAREIKRMQTQGDITSKNMREAWEFENSKLPPIRSMFGNLQRMDLQGLDTAEQLAEIKKLYEATGPGMEDLTTNYRTTGPNIASLFGWFDNPQPVIEQAMRNREGGLERAFKWEELDYLKSKEGNDQADKFTTRALNKVGSLRSHLEAILRGEPVMERDPTGVIRKITQPMEAEQARNIGRTLSTLGDIETRILKKDFRQQDFDWIDDNWNNYRQNIIMTNAYKGVEAGNYKNLNDAIEQEMYKELKRVGEYEPREAGIGAPVSDALYKATGGEFSFHPDVDGSIKKKLYDAYMQIKQGVTDEQGNQLVDDAMIFAMLQREYPFLQDAFVKESDRAPQEDTTQTVDEATKGTENKTSSSKTSVNMSIREK